MNIIENKKIKEALLSRWKELNLNQADITRDAEKRAPDMKITTSRLSCYMHDKPAGLREDSLHWLCVRYGIPVQIVVGEPLYECEHVIPPYDEENCLKKLKTEFKKKA